MPVFLDVEYLDGWRLFLVLSDGITGMLDLTPWAALALFENLHQLDFARVSINAHGALAWSTGMTLQAVEIYHLIQPIDESAAFDLNC